MILSNFILLFTKNLKAIEIKNYNISLVFNKYFKESIELYLLSDLKFTYKIETGSKGSMSAEFRIYKNGDDKSIVSIGGFIDGWTEDKIYEIIEELNKLGIEVIE